MIRRGVDTDNYDGDVSVRRFESLKEKGFDFVIVGAQVGTDGKNYTRLQIDNARAADLEVPAVYELLYWDDRDITRMNRAKAHGLPVWIDCEYDIGLAPPEWIVGRIQAAVSFLGEQCAGIYTGSWWWKPSTNNSAAFAHLPLWHAAYPYGVGQLPPAGYTPDFNTFAPYGGWTRPTVWQYADVAPDELSFDSNAWEVSGVPVQPTEDELRLGVIKTITDGKYKPEYIGPNQIGERIVELLNGDGTKAQPPIILAVPKK